MPCLCTSTCIVESSPSKYSFYWSDHFLWKSGMWSGSQHAHLDMNSNRLGVFVSQYSAVPTSVVTFSQVFSYKAETYFVDRSTPWIQILNYSMRMLLHCNVKRNHFFGQAVTYCVCEFMPFLWWLVILFHEPCLTCPWFKIVQLLLLMMVCHSLLLSSSESVPTVCAVLDEHNSKLEGGVSTLQHTQRWHTAQSLFIHNLPLIVTLKAKVISDWRNILFGYY